MFFSVPKLLALSLLALSTAVYAAPSTPTADDVTRREHIPTRVEARHGGGAKPAPSQGGSPSGKKCIKVTKKLGQTILTLGFVGDSLSDKGRFKITPWRWDCLEVIVPSTPAPFDLPIKGQNGSKKFLGLAGDDAKSALSLVRTAQTPANSPPQSVGNTGLNLPLSESAVWSSNGGKLTASWVSQAGAVVSAKAFHWLGNLENVYFVTKPREFSEHHFGAYEVTLELVTP